MVVWVRAVYAVGFLLLAAGNATVSAQSTEARSLQEIDEEIADALLPESVRFYRSGVRVIGRKGDSDDFGFILNNFLHRPLPAIRVRAPTGWVTVSSCQEFFVTRMSGRLAVDRGLTPWFHYGSCDYNASLVMLATPNEIRLDPHQMLREMITSLRVHAFEWPQSIKHRLRSYGADVTVLALWPLANFPRDGWRDGARNVSSKSITLSFSWGQIAFSLSGFGDFDGDGVDDALVSTYVNENPGRPVECYHDSLSRVTRLQPNGQLTVHPVAHTHNRCHGPGYPGGRYAN